MRYVSALAVLCFGLQVVNAQVSPPREPATPPATRSDVMADTLWRIAVASHTRIGFETAELRTHPFTALKDQPSLGDWSLERTLDTAMAMDDRYEWRKVGDMVIVRPKTAWTDATDPLNRPVRNLQVNDRAIADVVAGIRDFVYTNRLEFPHRVSAPGDLSFKVDSGSVVDVLNQLIGVADQTIWVVASVPHQAPERWWDLTVEIRNREHVTGYSGSRKDRLRLPR